MDPKTQATADADEDLVASEYLTFTLGSEEYAIDILKVQEIRGYEAPTLIANAPAFIKGVINLRGIIVPSSICASNSTLATSNTRLSPSSSFSISEILYMGDDLFDLPLIERAGVGITVPEALDKIKLKADYVTIQSGGKGAVREICEMMLNHGVL